MRRVMYHVEDSTFAKTMKLTSAFVSVSLPKVTGFTVARFQGCVCRTLFLKPQGAARRP